MGIAFLPGPNPVWGFANNPPTGGIILTSILYNISGFISTPASYGVAVNCYEHAGTAYLTFTRMYGGQGQFTVYYSTSNGTAIAGVDYTAVSGTLIFPHLVAGGAQTVQVPLLATSDTTTKTFNFYLDVQIGSAFFHTQYVFKGGNYDPFPSANYTAHGFTFPVNIIRQTNGIVQFCGTPYSVQRPGGTTTVTLQVQRVSGFKGAVGCSFHTTDGTAASGVAYTAQTGTLSWAAGEGGPKPITITILNGGSGTQSFTVTIDTPTGGTTIGSIPIATVDIVAAAPPTNPTSSGSIPNQIVNNLDGDDLTNCQVTVQPSNLVITDYSSVINKNFLHNAYASSGPRLDFNSTFWTSTTTGWIVGDGGWIIKTTDSGATWTVQSSGTNANLYDVFFSDASNGWAVGTNGVIFVTANGGTAWTAQTSGVSTDLNGVSFISSSIGWAVGVDGVIRTTANGGTLWSAQTSGIGTILNEIHAIDSTHVWAVGDNGVILFYNGTSWSTQTSGVSSDLNGVYFASTTVGWAVGDGGVILGTTNGGSTWTPQTSGVTQNLYDVNFQSTTVGWIVGGNGTILATTNGGSISWVGQASGVTVDLNAIDAASTSVAYIVGNNATFLVTTDGGSTWVLTPAPSPIGVGGTGNFGGGSDFANYDEGFSQSMFGRFQGMES